MSISVVRYIELLAVNDQRSNPFLQVSIFLNEPVEVFMEVDLFTVQSLQAQCNLDQHYKYRLSLRALEELYSDRIYSTITKTFLTQSERIDFDVSPLYKRQIEQIKNCTTIDELFALPFIQPLHNDLTAISEEETTKDEQEDEIDTVIEATEEQVEEKITQPILVDEQPLIEDHISANSTDEAIDDLATTEKQNVQPIHQEHTEREQTIVEQHDSIVKDELSENVKNQDSINEQQNVTAIKPIKRKRNKQPKKSAAPNNPFKSPIVVIATLFIVVAAILAAIQLAPSNSSNSDADDISKTEANSSTAKKEVYAVDEQYTFGLPDQYAAITFTKGPSPYTEDIIAILEKHNIGAAFFLVGKHVSQYADKVTLLHEKGFTIGHATEQYTLLTTMPKDQQLLTIETTAQKIEQLIQVKPTLFRPPYGLFNGVTQEIVDEQNLQVIDWTLDPYDVKAQIATDIVQYLEGQQLKGSIINLHESAATVEALPQIIALLQQQNLKIVMLQ